VKELTFDTLVVGAGAAGMAAALVLEERGASVALIDREERLGGILFQCIHNGFGLHEFDEELTGPEYADRFVTRIESRPRISVFLRTTLMDVENGAGPQKVASCYTPVHGVLKLRVRAIVLAMGCRERNRGNIRIPGTRPAGIFTAGLAQRLVNIEGYVPGREVVIVGSGDIGLIMARRMVWIGARVHAVVEILPYPSGITRNIVQCLNDFDIPLYLSHVVSRIEGRDRIEGVQVTPLVDGKAEEQKAFRIPCDTLLLSVGLVPENDLSKKMGVEINPQTNGPYVDSTMMTSVDGVFATGNVLHVHDLVDFVSEESARTGGFVADYLEGRRPASQIRIKPGANIRYVNPGRLDPAAESTKLYFRSLIVKNSAVVEARLAGNLVRQAKKSHVQPSEMITLTLERKDLERVAVGPDAALEVSLT
jgi:NADPH-dependent 2,4-dienoyl-CoA reductase/sulfur reductase-like enzyme